MRRLCVAHHLREPGDDAVASRAPPPFRFPHTVCAGFVTLRSRPCGGGAYA